MTDKIKLREYGFRLDKRVTLLISLMIKNSIGDGFAFEKDTKLLLTKYVNLRSSGLGNANGNTANLVSFRTFSA